jgi:hypothetical protein
MPDSKISGLTEGTVVDPANDWFVYVDTSDTTQDLLTGTTKKVLVNTILSLASSQIDGGIPASVYGGTTAIDGGTP